MRSTSRVKRDAIDPVAAEQDWGGQTIASMTMPVDGYRRSSRGIFPKGDLLRVFDLLGFSQLA